MNTEYKKSFLIKNICGENMDHVTYMNKDDIARQSEAISPVANYLLKAVSFRLIPLCRRDRMGGQLYYRPLSSNSVQGFLLWLLLPALLFVPTLIYIRSQDDLWEEFLIVLVSSLVSSTVDFIPICLSFIIMILIGVFLPGTIANLLAAIQDVIPIQQITWPGPNQRPWLLLISAVLIPVFISLEVINILLLCWRASAATSGTIMALVCIAILLVMYNTMALILLAEIVTTYCMAHLRSRCWELQAKVKKEGKRAHPSLILAEAEKLLAEFQLVRHSLEPVLFLLTSATTLLLVLDLFYTTHINIDHLMRPLIFMQQLIINMCLLLHLSFSAEDCYTDFKSMLVHIRLELISE